MTDAFTIAQRAWTAKDWRSALLTDMEVTQDELGDSQSQPGFDREHAALTALCDALDALLKPRSLLRCLACFEPWVGEFNERCDICRAKGRPIAPYFAAKKREREFKSRAANEPPLQWVANITGLSEERIAALGHTADALYARNATLDEFRAAGIHPIIGEEIV